MLSVKGCSALPGEQVPQGVVVVLIKGGVYERVKEGVGVAQPQEDALPDGGDVAGTQRDDELGDEEGDPAEDEHADQNADHERRLFLLLLAPRVAVRLEGHGGVAHGKHHLGLMCFLFYLRGSQWERKDRESTVASIHQSIKHTWSEASRHNAGEEQQLLKWKMFCGRSTKARL